MTITVEIRGRVARIVLSGGIDYATQDEFRNATKKTLAEEDVSDIYVDFAQANFLDSSGIRALLILKKETEKSGKSLFLSNCNPYLLEIFEIGGFNKVFTFR